MSRRSEALAKRIEEGADNLATFVETLSASEWYLPVSETDRRSIGVIVHHVASMYPIEIDLARAIASGKAVTDVTWGVVAQINAKHAVEQSKITRAPALELLWHSSREAAAAVRKFSDDELDQAAPLSLNDEAPLTTQFVIEDHALRHSWHHLALSRAAVSSVREQKAA